MPYSNILNFQTSIICGLVFSEHVRHLGFLLRTMLFCELMTQCTPPASIQLVCLYWRKLVHDSRPMACCYVCFGLSVPSKLVVVIFSGHTGFFPQGKNRLQTGMTLHVQQKFRTLIKPHSFLGVFFFYRTIAQGVWCPAAANSPLPYGLWELTLLGWSPDTTTTRYIADWFYLIVNHLFSY